MDFMLSRATRVTAQWASAPVQHAVARFWRDMEMTLSTTGFVPDNRLMICLAPALPPESYTLDVTENQLTLCAADDLGAVRPAGYQPSLPGGSTILVLESAAV